MKPIYLFDLDGTVIDSWHRVAPHLDANGRLDLEAYKLHACTHAAIMGDTLLPLADYMRQLIAQGATVGICTARHLGKSDHLFLKTHGIKAPLIMSRDRLHKAFDPVTAVGLHASPDPVYKAAWLKHIQGQAKGRQIHLYDDHQGILKAAAALGVVALDAIKINRFLA